MTELEKGTIYTFGSFPGGKDGEISPIEWIVIDTDEKEGKALIISRYALTAMRYDTYDTSDETYAASWETSELRHYLNGEFLSSAFTEEEQGRILVSHVSADPNPDFDTWQGSDTEDRIFLLSSCETERYFPSYESRYCRGTEYAVSHNMHVLRWDETFDIDDKIYEGNAWWRLRTIGNSPQMAVMVSAKGTLYNPGMPVLKRNIGIRPALWIRIK